MGQGGQLLKTLKITLSATYMLALLSILAIFVLPAAVFNNLIDLYTAKDPRRFIFIAAFPVLFLTLRHVVPTCSPYSNHLLCMPSPNSSVDLVIAHYDKPLPVLKDHLNYLLRHPFVRRSRVRIFIYEKGVVPHQELWDSLPLLEGRDTITQLENVGREGDTYFKHILSLYNSTNTTTTPIHPSGFADHTFFLQAHLAWEKVAIPRIDAIYSSTGFISLGPYMRNECGLDGRGTGEYILMKEVWRILRGKECDKPQLSSWAGQFVVSRERILGNTVEGYKKLDDMLEVSYF